MITVASKQMRDCYGNELTVKLLKSKAEESKEWNFCSCCKKEISPLFAYRSEQYSYSYYYGRFCSDSCFRDFHYDKGWGQKELMVVPQ